MEKTKSYPITRAVVFFILIFIILFSGLIFYREFSDRQCTPGDFLLPIVLISIIIAIAFSVLAEINIPKHIDEAML